ncbi:MAG: hypothetical protein Q7K03_11280 [Dehalococcoidia bacterium]|nr:hypothetical protein [Dehalococcoidia bacterium]
MADGFDAFCAQILARPTWPGNLSPAALAGEFVRHFELSGFPRFDHLEHLVRQAGVGQVVEARLPDRLRGVHVGLRNGHYTIKYRDDDWDGGREHTVLHETYEILQEKFSEMCPSWRLPGKQRLCRMADRFAAAVLMQPEVFALFAQAAGLDVVALQHMYRRAYASVALRLVEVMHQQPMLVAVYDRCEEGEPSTWKDANDASVFRVGVAVRTRGFSVIPKGHRHSPSACPRQMVPRRHAPVLQGSAAWRVVQSGGPVLVERVAGCDLWGPGDLTVVARPVRWYGKLAKVALVAVPYRDRLLLEPQFGQGPLERVPMAFQVI